MDRFTSGHLILKEHQAAKWLSKEEMDSVAWLPADRIILKKIQNALSTSPLH